MDLMLLPIGSLLLLCICAMVMSISNLRRAQSAERRERQWEQMHKNLVATLEQTTANLQMQNATVEKLLSEKREAWGLPNKHT